MTHELYPDLFAHNDRTVAWKQAVIGRAERIIAISENTRTDLVRHYRVDEKRVEVVHLASSLPTSNDISRLADLPGHYLLFVGQRGGYKNFSSFVRAVAPVMKDNPELFIVCAGGGTFSAQELLMMGELGLGSRVRQYPTDDNLLATLYRRAAAFVFPSLYEGFGIPVLEAFSAGCPALLSNRSSLPEIGGEAALYFDPEDEDSLRSVVVRLINDTNLRNMLVTLGTERAKEFSWGKVARKTKAVYESVL